MAAGLVAAAIWGGMYVVSKYVLEIVPAPGLVWLRLTIGALTLGALAAATRVWRDLFPDPYGLCREGLAFMKGRAGLA